MKLSLNTLYAYLQGQKLAPEHQSESRQVYVAISHKKVPLAFFFRILGDGELLQIIAGLPVQPEKEAFDDLSRLLHKINFELDLPGFGLNEAAHAVFFRFILPCPKQHCDETLLNHFLKLIPEACATYYPVISAVSRRQKTYEELLV